MNMPVLNTTSLHPSFPVSKQFHNVDEFSGDMLCMQTCHCRNAIIILHIGKTIFKQNSRILFEIFEWGHMNWCEGPDPAHEMLQISDSCKHITTDSYYKWYAQLWFIISKYLNSYVLVKGNRSSEETEERLDHPSHSYFRRLQRSFPTENGSGMDWTEFYQSF